MGSHRRFAGITMAINSGNTSGPRKNDVPNIVGDDATVAEPKITNAGFDVRNGKYHTFK